ncbi:MAG TPA: hypothetical protein VIK00_06640 [Candidatus Limnocylindrales bacterium]
MNTHLMLGNEAVARGVYSYRADSERFFACTAHAQTEVDSSLEVIACAAKSPLLL